MRGPDLLQKRMNFGCAVMDSPFNQGKKAVLVAGGYSKINEVELLEYEDVINGEIKNQWRDSK